LTAKGNIQRRWAVPVPTAPLLEGDSLTTAEFLRRWERAGDYPSGAPELVLEVAISRRSRDFGARNGFTNGWEFGNT